MSGHKAIIVSTSELESRGRVGLRLLSDPRVIGKRGYTCVYVYMYM